MVLNSALRWLRPANSSGADVEATDLEAQPLDQLLSAAAVANRREVLVEERLA